MLIRRTNAVRGLSKSRLLDLTYMNCMLCKGRGVQKYTRMCKKCFYDSIVKQSITDFRR